jgi:hypothetical protein
MIYTSYFAQLRNLPPNIVPISICAKVPGFYKGLQYKKVAPKYGFFMEWKQNHDNDFYIEHYRDEVLNTLTFAKVMNDLQLLLPYEIREQMDSHISQNKDWHIALICYEKPDDFCHRHLFADWLIQNGVECKEWTKE